MRGGVVAIARRYPVATYFLAAFAVTWVVWVPRAEPERQEERARECERTHSRAAGRQRDAPGRGRGRQHDRDHGRGDTWGFDR